MSGRSSLDFGLPIRIQDVKGNEWTFQFRFWPNNNSRMYVLEGVTPCILSMQLQAGDTVTFSRLDPGNKLVIGFRKASQSVNMQGPVFQNGTHGETSFSSDHLATGSGDSSLFRMNNGSKDPSLTSPSDHHLAEWDKHMQNHENNGHRTSEDLLHPVSNSEKKRARNIGPKSKRFLMHSEDVMELRLTWEDAQDLLRPPPSIKPSIVTIEDFEFEEYDEPPVYGKRSIFTAGPSNKGQEQWAQCDDCFKWLKLPGEVLLPPRWRCSENSWDSSRALHEKKKRPRGGRTRLQFFFLVFICSFAYYIVHGYLFPSISIVSIVCLIWSNLISWLIIVKMYKFSCQSSI